MHLHTDEDEVFTVLSGTMGYILEGKEGTTSKGVSIPMGKEHTFWNADPKTDLTCKVNNFCLSILPPPHLQNHPALFRYAWLRCSEWM